MGKLRPRAVTWLTETTQASFLYKERWKKQAVEIPNIAQTKTFLWPDRSWLGLAKKTHFLSLNIASGRQGFTGTPNFPELLPLHEVQSCSHHWFLMYFQLAHSEQVNIWFDTYYMQLNSGEFFPLASIVLTAFSKHIFLPWILTTVGGEHILG